MSDLFSTNKKRFANSVARMGLLLLAILFSCDGEETVTSVASFTTTPHNGAPVLASTLYFLWPHWRDSGYEVGEKNDDDSEIVNLFHLEVAANDTFNDTLISVQQEDAIYHLTDSDRLKIALPGTYWWRFRGQMKGREWSDWSRALCFKILEPPIALADPPDLSDARIFAWANKETIIWHNSSSVLTYNSKTQKEEVLLDFGAAGTETKLRFTISGACLSDGTSPNEKVIALLTSDGMLFRISLATSTPVQVKNVQSYGPYIEQGSLVCDDAIPRFSARKDGLIFLKEDDVATLPSDWSVWASSLSGNSLFTLVSGPRIEQYQSCEECQYGWDKVASSSIALPLLEKISVLDIKDFFVTGLQVFIRTEGGVWVAPASDLYLSAFLSFSAFYPTYGASTFIGNCFGWICDCREGHVLLHQPSVSPVITEDIDVFLNGECDEVISRYAREDKKVDFAWIEEKNIFLFDLPLNWSYECSE